MERRAVGAAPSTVLLLLQFGETLNRERGINPRGRQLRRRDNI